MSQYACLVCERCRVGLFLGKAVRRAEPDGGESIDHFWRGDARPAAERQLDLPADDNYIAPF